MQTVTGTFTDSVQNSAPIMVRPGESFTYALVADGADEFIGTVLLTRSENQQAWETIESFVGTVADPLVTAAASGTVINTSSEDRFYRFTCSDFDDETDVSPEESDPIGYTLATVDEEAVIDVEFYNGKFVRKHGGKVLLSFDEDGIVTDKATIGELGSVPTNESGVGVVNGATVSAVEQGDVVHKTTFTLASTPVTVGNVTGASFGGVKLYDFPAGRILVLGVTADLSFNWAGTDIGLTGSGDFALGRSISADATLAGTDVDLLPSTALLDPFVDGVGTGKGALVASAQFDGTGGAISANLNIIIDDADVANAAEDIVLASGPVVIHWINLGDY